MGNQLRVRERLLKTVLRIILFVVLGGIGWLGWEYTRPSRFPLRHVRVFASYAHISESLLQESLASYWPRGFFYLNVMRMKRQLLALPWVDYVSVRRQWPDTLVIHLLEQQAILRWGDQALINVRGEIFTPPPATFPAALPILWGPSDRLAEIFTTYQQASKLLEPLKLTIVRLELARHYWEIKLGGNRVIYLREDRPMEQLHLLVEIYQRLIKGHTTPPQIVDLRYRSGLAAKW